MTQSPIAGPLANQPHHAGHPLVRVHSTEGTIYPFTLEFGDYATEQVPMTAAAVRDLRDALTEVLARTPQAQSPDFVAEWAQTHHARVVPGTLGAA
jgi:hypothetical protein